MTRTTTALAAGVLTLMIVMNVTAMIARMRHLLPHTVLAMLAIALLGLVFGGRRHG